MDGVRATVTHKSLGTGLQYFPERGGRDEYNCDRVHYGILQDIELLLSTWA